MDCSKAGYFNPELSQNSSSNFFSKERFRVLIKYCSDFPTEENVNPKTTAQISLFEDRNKKIGLNLNPGLTLVTGFIQIFKNKIPEQFYILTILISIASVV